MKFLTTQQGNGSVIIVTSPLRSVASLIDFLDFQASFISLRASLLQTELRIVRLVVVEAEIKQKNSIMSFHREIWKTFMASSVLIAWPDKLSNLSMTPKRYHDFLVNISKCCWIKFSSCIRNLKTETSWLPCTGNLELILKTNSLTTQFRLLFGRLLCSWGRASLSFLLRWHLRIEKIIKIDEQHSRRNENGNKPLFSRYYWY